MNRTFAPRRIRGMSLIELMTALVIGAILIIGVTDAYSRSASAYRTHENIARAQERGRHVLAYIEPDIELAGYYGFTSAPIAIRFIHGGGAAFVPARALRQVSARMDDLLPLPVPNLPIGAHACGVNFAVDVLTRIEGANGTFALGRSRDDSCDAYRGRSQPGADTLTIRRADTRASPASAGRMQIYASRLTSRTSQLLFADGRAPGAVDDLHRIHNLVVRAYYVARDSVERPDFPALRVKSLTESGGSAAFIDDEVMPGVEDLQVQLGIDSGDYDNDGSLDPGIGERDDGAPGTDGRATRYVNPDFPGLARFQVVAVRIWVRVRADANEAGFDDSRTYRYADVIYNPSGADRSYRRVVMSRTIALRNARTL